MTNTNQKTEDSLLIARKYVEILPAPSSLFSSCIRAIKNAETALRGADQAPLKDLAVSSSSFLVSISPTLKGVFYRAAENLHKEELEKLSPLTTKGLLSLFEPSEITAILSLTYLFRHVRRKTDPAELDRLLKKMMTQIEIGSIVGKTIRHIGSGNGMLLGGMRYLSLALFSVVDIKKFQEMRRALDKADKLFDVERERELFGCTHLQISSYFAQVFGLGVTTAMGLALNQKEEDLQNYDEAVAEELLCWRIAIMMTEAFHQSGTLPTVGEDNEMYLPPEELEALKKHCWSVLRDGTTLDWLTFSHKNLSDDVRKALEITVKIQKKNGIEEFEEGEDSAG